MNRIPPEKNESRIYDELFSIQKGIPVPLARSGRRGSALRHTLKKMAIGDCIDVPLELYKRPNMHQIAWRMGMQIMIRNQTVDGKGLWRVWKIAEGLTRDGRVKRRYRSVTKERAIPVAKIR